MQKKLHDISELESLMTKEQLAQARKLAESDSLNIKINKLISGRSTKISTLIDYLSSLGMGLEISAFSKTPSAKKEVLLRI